MQSTSTMGQHSLMDRIMGVVTLKAPIYREIADDQTATTTAAIIVVVMAVIGGILAALVAGIAGSAIPTGLPDGTTVAAAVNPIGTFIRTIINTIISWLIGSWVFAFVSTTFFGGKTNMWEMARVFGFTQVFQVLNVIPCLGSIAALVLSVIGAIIGIREASEFDTTKAVLTGVVGLIVMFIVSIIVGLILAPLGL